MATKQTAKKSTSPAKKAKASAKRKKPSPRASTRPAKKTKKASAARQGKAAGSSRRGARVAAPEARVRVPNANINATDRQLLVLLQADGRQSNLALAKAVGLSPAACHDRVRKLISQGLITHFSGHLNAQALDVGLVVFATLQLDRTVPSVVAQLREAVDANPAFMECHLIAGGADALLKVRTSDLHSYQQLLEAVIYPIAGVRSVNSHASLQTVKETSAIAL